MKKSTMIAAIFAASAFSALAADVYSSNIVGYSKIDLRGQYDVITAPFVTIGADTWRLGDVKVTGMDPFSDTVQVLSLTDASTTSQYTYIDLATATDVYEEPTLVGWWDVTLIGSEGGRADDVTFEAGQGLLCNISSPTVQFTYAGEVIQGVSEVPLLGQYAMLSNPLPQAITLGQIEAIGMDPFSDTVQVLSLTDASTVSQYTYIDLATATDVYEEPTLVGWWDVTLIGSEGGRADDVVIPAGMGMLCNVSSAGVSFIFPDVTTPAP